MGDPFEQTNPSLNVRGKMRLGQTHPPPALSPKSNRKRGNLYRKEGRSWNVMTWCELQIDTKKLRFYDNEQQEGEAYVLELAGCSARALEPRLEREYAFEIYTHSSNHTLEKLAATTARDFEQWLTILTQVVEVTEHTEERLSDIRKSSSEVRRSISKRFKSIDVSSEAPVSTTHVTLAGNDTAIIIKKQGKQQKYEAPGRRKRGSKKKLKEQMDKDLPPPMFPDEDLPPPAPEEDIPPPPLDEDVPPPPLITDEDGRKTSQVEVKTDMRPSQLQRNSSSKSSLSLSTKSELPRSGSVSGIRKLFEVSVATGDTTFTGTSNVPTSPRALNNQQSLTKLSVDMPEADSKNDSPKVSSIMTENADRKPPLPAPASIANQTAVPTLQTQTQVLGQTDSGTLANLPPPPPPIPATSMQRNAPGESIVVPVKAGMAGNEVTGSVEGKRISADVPPPLVPNSTAVTSSGPVPAINALPPTPVPSMFNNPNNKNTVPGGAAGSPSAPIPSVDSLAQELPPPPAAPEYSQVSRIVSEPVEKVVSTALPPPPPGSFSQPAAILPPPPTVRPPINTTTVRPSLPTTALPPPPAAASIPITALPPPPATASIPITALPPPPAAGSQNSSVTDRVITSRPNSGASKSLNTSVTQQSRPVLAELSTQLPPPPPPTSSSTVLFLSMPPPPPPPSSSPPTSPAQVKRSSSVRFPTSPLSVRREVSDRSSLSLPPAPPMVRGRESSVRSSLSLPPPPPLVNSASSGTQLQFPPPPAPAASAVNQLTTTQPQVPIDIPPPPASTQPAFTSVAPSASQNLFTQRIEPPQLTKDAATNQQLAASPMQQNPHPSNSLPQNPGGIPAPQLTGFPPAPNASMSLHQSSEQPQPWHQSAPTPMQQNVHPSMPGYGSGSFPGDPIALPQGPYTNSQTLPSSMFSNQPNYQPQSYGHGDPHAMQVGYNPAMMYPQYPTMPQNMPQFSNGSQQFPPYNSMPGGYYGMQQSSFYPNQPQWGSTGPQNMHFDPRAQSAFQAPYGVPQAPPQQPFDSTWQQIPYGQPNPTSMTNHPNAGVPQSITPPTPDNSYPRPEGTSSASRGVVSYAQVPAQAGLANSNLGLGGTSVPAHAPNPPVHNAAVTMPPAIPHTNTAPIPPVLPRTNTAPMPPGLPGASTAPAPPALPGAKATPNGKGVAVPPTLPGRPPALPATPSTPARPSGLNLMAALGNVKLKKSEANEASSPKESGSGMGDILSMIKNGGVRLKARASEDKPPPIAAAPQNDIVSQLKAGVQLKKSTPRELKAVPPPAASPLSAVRLRSRTTENRQPVTDSTPEDNGSGSLAAGTSPIGGVKLRRVAPKEDTPAPREETPVAAGVATVVPNCGGLTTPAAVGASQTSAPNLRQSMTREDSSTALAPEDECLSSRVSESGVSALASRFGSSTTSKSSAFAEIKRKNRESAEAKKRAMEAAQANG